MNLSAHQRRTAGVRQVGLCLASCLLASAALASRSIAPETGRSWVTRPYLTVVEAAPLRFEERPAPPPTPLLRAEAGASPRQGTEISASGQTTPRSAGRELPPTDGTAALPPEAPATGTPNLVPKEKPEKPGSPPPAILPDDTRPKVRAEDFLPFFQFPGSGSNPNDVTVVPAPAEPGKLPPSSATYRQQ